MLLNSAAIRFLSKEFKMLQVSGDIRVKRRAVNDNDENTKGLLVASFIMLIS